MSMLTDMPHSWRSQLQVIHTSSNTFLIVSGSWVTNTSHTVICLKLRGADSYGDIALMFSFVLSKAQPLFERNLSHSTSFLLNIYFFFHFSGSNIFLYALHIAVYTIVGSNGGFAWICEYSDCDVDMSHFLSSFGIDSATVFLISGFCSNTLRKSSLTLYLS